MNKQWIVVAVVALAVLLFGLGTYVYTGQKRQAATQAAQNNEQSLTRAHSPVFGSKEAKVTIVEFFDPSCEACRAFYPIVKGIVNGSFGQVNLVLRYAAFHQGSDEAVKILEAAKLQNLYWPVLEAVIKSQPEWASHQNPQPELIWNFIQGTGIDVAKAKIDAKDPAIGKLLDQDMADGRALKVNKTPAFFVNGKPLTDFGVEQLKALVAKEVSQAYGK